MDVGGIGTGGRVLLVCLLGGETCWIYHEIAKVVLDGLLIQSEASIACGHRAFSIDVLGAWR